MLARELFECCWNIHLPFSTGDNMIVFYDAFIRTVEGAWRHDIWQTTSIVFLLQP